MQFLSLVCALTFSAYLCSSLNQAKPNIGYSFPYTLESGFCTPQPRLFCSIDPRQEPAEASAAAKSKWQKSTRGAGGGCCSITEPTEAPLGAGQLPGSPMQ